TAHRPDIIVVLEVGVINYTAQFVGAGNMGDLAVASDDEFVIPPCYVHLVAREDGAFSLNRLFTHLLAHLALYPRRPSIPPFSVLLEGTSSIVHGFGTYQYNTERRLVRYEPPPVTPSKQNPVIRIRDKVSKEELAIARVFLGLMEMARKTFPSSHDKEAFDEHFSGTLSAALELRKTLV